MPLSKKKGIQMIEEYMQIADPDAPILKNVWYAGKMKKVTPEVTRTAYYWMAMGIAQFLQSDGTNPRWRFDT